jgi:hypothetical protein
VCRCRRARNRQPLPLPYGYYTLLRLVACGVFAAGAWVLADRGHQAAATGFVLAALLFNPVLPVHLERETWAVIDVLAAGALWAFRDQLGERKTGQ